jgi:hypothetical protein
MIFLAFVFENVRGKKGYAPQADHNKKTHSNILFATPNRNT